MLKARIAALFWGAQRRNVDTVRMCLRMGAKVKVMDRGRTPLSLAAEHGHTAVVKRLLETEEVDADSNRGDDRTPLSVAAEHDCGEMVKLLLETGWVDVDSKDAVILGCTPCSTGSIQGGQEAYGAATGTVSKVG